MTVFAGAALAQAPTPATAPKPRPQTAAPKPATTKVAVSTSPNPTFDEGTAQRISAAMLSYSALEVQGGWPTLPANAKLVPGAKGPDVALLRKRLAITDDLPADKVAGDAYDDAVVAAVRHFQARHGLEETGTIGPKTLAALNVPVSKRSASSRPRSTGSRRWISTSASATSWSTCRPRSRRRSTATRSCAATWCRSAAPTGPSPTLTTNITTVNLNPTWTVPLGILKKDVIPKMRKDPGYAARMHMKVLDGAGREVDPHAVDWNSDRAPNFTIRQDSGNWNALGSVRIDMPNPHSVYMHDTNHKEFFSADYRFQSSGCTRVEDPRDTRRLGAGGQCRAGAARRSTPPSPRASSIDVQLAHKIPVAWVYLTGWATRDGAIHFRDDIYGHDDKPARWSPMRGRRSRARRAPRVSCYSPPTRPPVQQVSFLDSQ